METGTIVTVIILLIICVTPFIFMNRGKKKKRRKYYSQLEKMAQEVGGNVEEYEIANHYLIGIDQTKNKLFFKRVLTGKEEIVDLNIIKSCSQQQKKRTVHGEQMIDTVELKLISKKQSEAAITLVFYDVNKDGQLTDEISALKKWTGIINKML